MALFHTAAEHVSRVEEQGMGHHAKADTPPRVIHRLKVAKEARKAKVTMLEKEAKQ
jgi:hypothetical protein